VLKIGYKASAEQFGPRQLLDLVVEADRLGFDSAFISDHFQPWRHSGGHAPSALSWLGAAGSATQRIQLGTSVLTPTFRYHPSIIAQVFATLGVLFPNRIILGVGTGEGLNEVPAIGIVWPEIKERFARLREGLQLIRRLWSEERVSFSGEYYSTENATIYDRPTEALPIFVAGAGPMIAKYAGRHADGFICTSGKPQDLYLQTLLPNVDAGHALRETPASTFDRMIEMKVSFDDNKERAMHDTRFWGALALSAEEKMAIEDPLEMERLADALPIERVAKRWIVSSDPEEHVEMIKPYIAMGFNHLVFHAPGPDQVRFMRLYSDQIIPRLMALA
jgi:coenzyme F420-dependent glucose-6-phosphate dehydrogenase